MSNDGRSRYEILTDETEVQSVYDFWTVDTGVVLCIRRIVSFKISKKVWTGQRAKRLRDYIYIIYNMSRKRESFVANF